MLSRRLGCHKPYARVECRPNSSRPLLFRPKTRTTAAADDAGGAIAVVGSLGIVSGALFAALYVLERQSKEALERKVGRLEAEIKERDTRLTAAADEVALAKKQADENDMFRRRYDDATRDILKLERALELKDGQLESFMVVAQRQIAYLESRVREAQQ